VATISVCMIVKNEEAVLARCLDCLKGLADQIIIVDTGSSDRTMKIARKYTPKVYSFPWNEDFSEARNFAFSKATGDYIYSADADEIIDAENQVRFLTLKKSISPETEVVQFRYANQLSFNTTCNFDTEYRPKLFKRLRTFHWVEPIHEMVDLKVHVLESDIVIIHAPENQHSPRDFSIFRKAAAQGGLNSRLHRMYGKELFIAGADSDFLDAYPYFERTLHDEARNLDDIRVSQCVVARCARLKKNSTELFKAALKNVIGGKPSAEVCCELGAFFLENRDSEEAAAWYYTAAFGAECECDIRYSGNLPLLRLSECYRSLGMPDEAEKYRAQAENWAPPKGD
jgi:glycosyltransferase involved in cell wall biosynthesis